MKIRLKISTIFFPVVLFFCTAHLSAQKSQTVTFQTLAQCGMCKERIGGNEFCSRCSICGINMEDKVSQSLSQKNHGR